MSTDKLQSRLFKRFHEACCRFSLLQDGDKVLIGLSGGKDSLLLTELLGKQARIFRPRIEVAAIHIRVANRNYISDLSYLQQFCGKAGVPFIVKDTAIVGEEKKDPCFLCSWYRRKALFDYALEHGYNKIAFGHHRDDILTTALLNLIYVGRFSSIEPSLRLDKMPLTLIRPLCLIDEQDIIAYSQSAGYEKQKALCPFEKHSDRHKMATLLEDLKTFNPDVRSSIEHALYRKGGK